MFFLGCFSVFIVNFEHVNVSLDNSCIPKSFKTYLKSLAKNEYSCCQNRYLLRIKNSDSHQESEQSILKAEIGFY